MVHGMEHRAAEQYLSSPAHCQKSPASPKWDAGVLAGNHHAMAKLRGMGPLLSPTSLGDVQESRLLSPPFSKRDVSMKFVAKAEASPEKHK